MELLILSMLFGFVMGFGTGMLIIMYKIGK
jgi:hypothetical protein